MHGWIAILYAAIVAGADKSSLFIENGGADGDAAFGESFAGFGDGGGEHGVVVESVSHWRDYTRVAVAKGDYTRFWWRYSPRKHRDDGLRWHPSSILACGRLACRIV